MKKLILLFSCMGCFYATIAQKPWDSHLNDLDPADSPRIGTLNTAPFDIYTNGIKRIGISAIGEISLPGVSLTADGGPSLLSVDQEGFLRPIGGGINYNCSSIVPWYVGGNQQSSSTDIGTCDYQDFVLKANNTQLLFIKADNPFIGIGPGNSSPNGTLDISNGNNGSLGVPDHTIIHGDGQGTIESTGGIRLLSTEGFSYEVGSSSGGASSKFTVTNLGNVGINAPVPTALIDARKLSNAEIRILSTSSTPSPSKMWVGNSVYSYNFGIDAGGIGRIGSNINLTTQNNIINFKFDPSLGAQVWVGDMKQAVSTSHADFRMAVDGKLVAKEVIVTPNNWADFVFDKNYDLMPLADLEKFYSDNHHLPDVPTTEQVMEKGVDLGKTDAILLQKIEELTLYIVAQQKQITGQQQKIEKLTKLVENNR